MGHTVEVFPHPACRQTYRRLRARDLNDRLLQSTPAVNHVVSRTASEMESRETQSWWQSAPIFRDLSRAECEQMFSTALRRQYEPRTVIVQEGDAGGQVLIASSGRVKISQVSHTGEEVILRIRGAGDVLGGLGMTAGEVHTSTIRALEACTVVSWPADEFEQLCASSPALQRNALQIMHDALQILQDCFCEMATLRASSRLARTLVRLAQQNGCGVERARITFTCEELGQMAGTTLFTVSRLLSKWAERGLVYAENREIVLEDIEELLAFADESPAAEKPLPIR
jgi:CRP-like cAMP-binding protein